MIEIISIGSELVTGQTINTNASLIANALLKKGYLVKQITTVPDEKPLLEEAIARAMKRACVIIMTGGLGPTEDDITRQTVAQFFNLPLKKEATLAADLKERYGEELETIEDQSTIIEGAEMIPNLFGTAPGFLLKRGKSHLLAFPGVPHQMEPMLEQYGIPYLAQIVPKEWFQKSLFLCLLYENGVDLYLSQLAANYPDLKYGICPSYGTLSIYLKIKARSQSQADKKLAPILSDLHAQYKEHIFSETDPKIEAAIQKQFLAKQLKLACAESCTGGRIGSRLTSISGSSGYFLGSLVTYSNGMKQRVLNVRPETIETHGAVSCETAYEMVEGLLSLSKADYAIAVSGIAGPNGGTQEKPVGTIWGAIATRNGEKFGGLLKPKGKKTRETLIDFSTTYLLSHLWRYIESDIPPFN